MGFEGSLDTVSFGDILNTLCNLSKEGVLTVYDDKQKKVIHFYNNGITLIGGSQRVKIGDMLVQQGIIQKWELDNALAEQQQSNKMLGSILVEQGLVSQEAIEQIISDQIEQEICDIFFWENAFFSFQEGPPQEAFANDQAQISLTFDVQSLLLRIADQIGQWEQIRKEVPSFSLLFMVIAENIELTVPETETEDNFQQVLQYLDGTHDVNDIMRLSQLPVLTVSRILAFLRQQGIIRPANFEELQQVGEFYQQKGQVQKQIHFLEMALILRPADQALLLKIAQTYESLGGKEAGQYYYKLGEASNDPKQAIQYLERAISYQPKAIEPREKLLDLAKYLEDEKKELYNSKMLVKLYQEEKKWDKVISLSQVYLERYPKELDLRRYLVNAYLDANQTANAVEEYLKIAATLETAGNTKLCVETLHKILQLDASREDVAKKIKRLQRTATWEGNRSWLIPATVGGIALISGIVYYIWFYEMPARSLYFHAKTEWLAATDSNYDEIKKIHENTKQEYEKIITQYPWSTKVSDAKASLAEQEQFCQDLEKKDKAKFATQEKNLAEQLKRVEDIAKLGKFAEAKAYMAKYKREYLANRWRPFLEKTEKTIQQIEQQLSREKADNRWQWAQKHESLREWEQALALYKELRELPDYKKEAEAAILRIQGSQINALIAEIRDICNNGLQKEREGDWKSSAELYKKVEILYIQTSHHSGELTAANREKLKEIRQIAQDGKQRLDAWEQKAMRQLETAQKLENDNRLAEANQKVIEVADDPILGKTAVAQNAHLAFKLESEPPGAKIQGSNAVTPHIAWVNPKEKLELVLELTGFNPLTIILDKKSQPLLQLRLSKISRWNYDTKGPIWGKMIPYQNSLIVTSRSGKIIALQQATGKLLWEYQIPSRWGDIVEGAAIWNKNIYVGSNDQNCYALNLDGGRLLWKFTAKGFIQVTPALEEKALYFGTTEGMIYSVDRQTGQTLWEYSLGKNAIKTSPVLWSKQVIFSTADGKLLGLDIVTGNQVWGKKFDGFATHPVMASAQLFLGTGNRKLVCMNLNKESIAWEAELDGEICKITVVAGNVYIGTHNGYFYKISRTDGLMTWRAKLPKGVYAAPAQVSENTLYAACADSFLYLLDATSGNILWQEQYGNKGIRSDIITTDNAIYLATENGVVYALAK